MNKVDEIFSRLKAFYPAARCELGYNSVFELLVAVILSAQCTDKRVNEVTRELFVRANTPEQFAEMDIDELEKYIFSCGFYHNKAKNIIAASKDICERFGGKVPSTLEELTSLSGVGRKTANVVLNVAFHEPTIPVDTHVYRVSHRLGLSEGKTPEAVEADLMNCVPERYKGEAHHLLIFHGRYRCKAIRPECEGCPVADQCLEIKKINQNKE